MVSEERKEYLNTYRKAKLKRVPLDLKIEDYEELKEAAAKAGDTVNGFIKKAIAERMSHL